MTFEIDRGISCGRVSGTEQIICQLTLSEGNGICMLPHVAIFHEIRVV